MEVKGKRDVLLLIVGCLPATCPVLTVEMYNDDLLLASSTQILYGMGSPQRVLNDL
jgi:hypothetical protein